MVQHLCLRCSIFLLNVGIEGDSDRNRLQYVQFKMGIVGHEWLLSTDSSHRQGSWYCMDILSRMCWSERQGRSGSGGFKIASRNHAGQQRQWRTAETARSRIKGFGSKCGSSQEAYKRMNLAGLQLGGTMTSHHDQVPHR